MSPSAQWQPPNWARTTVWSVWCLFWNETALCCRQKKDTSWNSRWRKSRRTRRMPWGPGEWNSASEMRWNRCITFRTQWRPLLNIRGSRFRSISWKLQSETEKEPGSKHSFEMRWTYESNCRDGEKSAAESAPGAGSEADYR